MNEPAWAGSFAIVMVITSSQNQKYKYWASLLKKKYRERENAFLMEGSLLIKDGLSGGGELLEVILSSESSNREELLLEIGLEEAENEGPRVYVLDSLLFDNLVQTENGRFIIGVFCLPTWNESSLEGGKDLLVLESIQDPGNLGTMIRTAEAAGFAGIICTKGTVDVFSPKVVRASAGSVLRLPIIHGIDTEELKTILDRLELKTVAAMGEGDRNYWECDFTDGAAVIIGNEGAGLSKEMKEYAQFKVRIPMDGDIESLNAAMAAGILMYEVKRQKILA